MCRRAAMALHRQPSRSTSQAEALGAQSRRAAVVVHAATARPNDILVLGARALTARGARPGGRANVPRPRGCPRWQRAAAVAVLAQRLCRGGPPAAAAAFALAACGLRGPRGAAPPHNRGLSVPIAVRSEAGIARARPRARLARAILCRIRAAFAPTLNQNQINQAPSTVHFVQRVKLEQRWRDTQAETLSEASQDWLRHHPVGRYSSQYW